MSDVMEVLLINWGHPSRRVSAMMKPIFKQLIKINKQRGDAWIQNLIVRLLSSQTISLRCTVPVLLCVVPLVGAQKVLDVEPRFLSKLLNAIGNTENVALLVGQTIVKFVCATRKSKASSSTSWVQDISNAILGDVVAVRENVVTYVLPDLFKAMPASANMIFTCIRNQPLTTDDANASMAYIFTEANRKMAYLDSERASLGAGDVRLWAALKIMLVARQKGIKGSDKCVVQTDDAMGERGLPKSEILRAMRHENAEIRLAALGLLIACRKQTSPPANAEMNVIKECLPAIVKSPFAHERHKSRAMMRSYLERISKCIGAAKRLIIPVGEPEEFITEARTAKHEEAQSRLGEMDSFNLRDQR